MISVRCRSSTSTHHPDRVARAALLGLDLFMAVQAVFGGIGLLTGFIGTQQPEWLERSPFTTYIVPGLLLLVVVGGSSGAAAILLVRDKFVGAAVSVVAGCIAVGWIVVEMYWVPASPLQLLVAFMGILMIALGNILVADFSQFHGVSHPRHA